MSSEPNVESRRSTRVRLKVVIEARSLAEPLMCEGATIVVNRHGALISTAVPFFLTSCRLDSKELPLPRLVRAIARRHPAI
jgi:hypothetical protein